MRMAFMWLLTPLSGAMTHHIAPWTFWHARAMVLAWTILLPSGMLVARFCKVHPRQDWPATLDSKFWWRTHVTSQIGGVLAMLAGLALAWGHAGGSSGMARFHALLGWSAAALAAVQVAGGMLRGTKGGPQSTALRGDHYDMTMRRLLFEWLHKSLGWVAVPITIAAAVLGLVMADAPRWMLLTILIWWAGFFTLFAVLQRAGWCVDTYQAIWGTDPAHPGNQRRPIGVGIRRRSTEL